MEHIRKNMVFVFGSNEGGIHGAGAALTARKNHGAIMGCGFGHVNNSFAIPTKDRFIQRTLAFELIGSYVDAFLIYAQSRPELLFQVTAIGCGLAGLKHEDVASLFKIHPSNCWFDTVWKPYLPKGTVFWGTF